MLQFSIRNVAYFDIFNDKGPKIQKGGNIFLFWFKVLFLGPLKIGVFYEFPQLTEPNKQNFNLEFFSLSQWTELTC
jgi:hypothetical protein